MRRDVTRFHKINAYATFTNLACDDDNGSTVSGRSILYASGLTPGITYYIQVDGKISSTTAGTFCLTVDDLNSSMLSTSTACAAGKPLTLINDNYTGWLSVVGTTGRLIALINNLSGGATTSTYTSGININTAAVRQDATSLSYYLNRNYLINNASVSNVNVRFFFLNSELTSLQALDPGASLSNMQITRQTGTVCDNNFVAANGTNSILTPASSGSGTGISWIQVVTPG